MTFYERLTQLFDEKRHGGTFSGVVLIKRKDETLFEAALGYAHRSWKVANRMDTRFRIASISKMFTAVAILQLIDAGKLALDTRVRDALELGNTKVPADATVYHMLTMTSGMADWFDESGDWEKEWAALCHVHPIYLFRRNEDYLPLFVNEAPIAPAGERHQYNGAGYILLGILIEHLSGVSYFNYVRRHIFGR
ncbi:MAG: beta-lactamase family protein [Anaerolineae bacterium]|nr:beta-lactamase family protein [Anaerolineae bacterium]